MDPVDFQFLDKTSADSWAEKVRSTTPYTAMTEPSQLVPGVWFVTCYDQSGYSETLWHHAQVEEFIALYAQR
jgi:hypothetical protein